MKLYGHPYSNAARRVQMLCEECGIPYTYQLVDLMKGEQYTPEYLALNPNGKVPVIDDDGFVLWESQAIMRYLSDKHKAIPVRANPRRAFTSNSGSTGTTRLGPGRQGHVQYFLCRRQGNPQAIEDGKKWLAKILPVMDGALSKRKFLCGDQPTLADLTATTNLAYLETCQVDLSPYPAVTRWYGTMKGRPSFAKTAPK